MEMKEILSKVDHTLLSQSATWEQIKAICDDGMKYHTASVCIPASYVKQAKDYVGDDLLEEIKAVKQHCEGKLLKVIIETCLLTDDEKIKMCEIVSASGADYIKTSTGFSTAGATFHDVELFAAHVTNGVKIKAAGGISSIADAEKFIELGASRLGTSRIVKIVKQQEAEK